MSPESYYYIDTKESLAMMCVDLSREDVIGIDLECENNLHHYGAYITLIQISSRTKQWIVDMVALDSLGPLRKILTDNSIQKIFHDVSFDLRILNSQFSCKPKNVFDTQMAALLVGKTEIGLGPLLLEYFDVKKQTKFQMADWTKRPISSAMLSYAIKDSKYLIQLRDVLLDELKKLNRLDWIKEELELIESARYNSKAYTFKDFKGYVHLTDTQRSVLSVLFDLREKYAQEVDMPIHFIIPNKKLHELIVNPPKTVSQWHTISGVHPLVKRNASIFFKAVKDAQEKKITIPLKEHKRYNEEQKALLGSLGDLRDGVADKLGIARHLVMSKDQMHGIVRLKNLDSLRSWQKKVLMPKIADLVE